MVFCLKCLGVFKKCLEVLCEMRVRINIRILLPPVQQHSNCLYYSITTVARPVQHYLFRATKNGGRCVPVLHDICHHIFLYHNKLSGCCTGGSNFIIYLQAQRGFNCLKKSLPLSSTKMNAGKFSTRIFHTASMPSSGYSTHSMLLMFS